ncbi:MAG: hypothetical protein M1827_002300 [Pycnora praestabilis]|nr:MAG: hypothetical protein M1827_002300 [Pycnora praestabilis]
MISSPTPPTAILYQNESKTITLLDIPTSIAQAQGTTSHPNHCKLVSSEPIYEPYPSNEPKSEAAREKLRKRNGTLESERVHAQLRGHIRDALREIKQRYEGEWCLPRRVSPYQQAKRKHSRKRKATEVAATTIAVDEDRGPITQEPDFHTFTANLSAMSRFQPKDLLPIHLSPLLKESTINDFDNLSSLHNHIVCNHHPCPIRLDLDNQKHTFTIPPSSTFILSNIADSTSIFSSATHSLLPSPTPSAGLAQFNFILLDPPWSNRSVRRSGRYKTDDDGDLNLLRSALRNHVAPGGYVGIWVTNKAHHRSVADGLFREWGVRLVEKWMWVKTTVKGETVTELEGLWRRPYEIFCLGRRVAEGDCSPKLGNENLGAKTKIIVGVPDLHSRKPCLKELIEPYMPDPSNYRALEVFARHLTAGWWSWGDEVLKFNWVGNWESDDTGRIPVT